MWLTSVVLPLPRKPVTSVTGSRPAARRDGASKVAGGTLMAGWRRAAVEQVAGADRRLADPLAVGGGEGVQCPPAGAVAGDDVLDIEGSQRLDRLRDDMLHDAAQMQTAHHRVDRDVGKQTPHLGADIDDAGVGAGAEHDQAEIADVATSMRSSIS